MRCYAIAFYASLVVFVSIQGPSFDPYAQQHIDRNIFPDYFCYNAIAFSRSTTDSGAYCEPVHWNPWRIAPSCVYFPDEKSLCRSRNTNMEGSVIWE